nr:hypothetical protein [Tanacetum cinerariifolium]
MSAKRTVWNEFSSSMASAVICLVTVNDDVADNVADDVADVADNVADDVADVEKEEEEDEIPNATSPHPQDPIPTP